MHEARIRLECLKLAVEMCKTASAFDRPERTMELAKQFQDYCRGETSALELGAAVRAAGEPPLVKAPDIDVPDKRAGAMNKMSKKDMAKLLA